MTRLTVIKRGKPSYFVGSNVESLQIYYRIHNKRVPGNHVCVEITGLLWDSGKIIATVLNCL